MSVGSKIRFFQTYWRDDKLNDDLWFQLNKNIRKDRKWYSPPSQQAKLKTSEEKEVLQPNITSHRFSTADKKNIGPLHKKQNSSMHSEALKLCSVDHCFLQGDRGDNSMWANNVLNWSAIGCLALPVQVKLEWLWAAVRKACNWSPLHH